MSIALIATLAGLALVDSTSIGTLVIPLWMLLGSNRTPTRRIVVYLATIAIFYLAIGVVVTFALGAADPARLFRTPVGLWAQLSVGALLFAASWLFDSSKHRDPDRVVRWRERSMSTRGGTVRLALAAGTVELVMMLPYIAAIGIIARSEGPVLQQVSLLVGYCAMMVVPAAVLLAARSVMGSRLEPMLSTIDAFLSRHADSAVGWLFGIVGFLLVRDAAATLFFA